MDKITRAQKKAFKKYIKVATPLEVIDLYWRIKRATLSDKDRAWLAKRLKGVKIN
ncbi:MAG: hypothetical protein ACI4MN_05895 [Candidatus Coproplasma sp.]